MHKWVPCIQQKYSHENDVINEYTYTLETIVQAGRNKMAVTSADSYQSGVA